MAVVDATALQGNNKMAHIHSITSDRKGGMDLDRDPKIVAVNLTPISNTRVLNEVAYLSEGIEPKYFFILSTPDARIAFSHLGRISTYPPG
jgi:hypothetical protein